jgi:hypothetical protein
MFDIVLRILQGLEMPGFMTGLLGIGHALLRLADLARIPCMLALNPPENHKPVQISDLR